MRRAVIVTSLACAGCGEDERRCDVGSEVSWIPAAPMAAPRAGHTATRLASGEVLVTGGVRAHESPPRRETSAEIYDPASDTWRTVGAMHEPRSAHRAVLLPGSGMVLVVGGLDGPDVPELFDPATETWIQTDPMSVSHHVGALVALPDGSALVLGGFAVEGGPTTRVERLDPATRSWTVVGDTVDASSYDVAAHLDDGRVLLAGRELIPTGNTTSSEIFDPGAGTSSRTGPQARPHSYCASLAKLADGRLLLTGGESEDPAAGPSRDAFVPWLDVAELFDPTLETWRVTRPMTSDRCAHTTVTIGDGTVLAAGGWYDTRAFHVASDTEIYDPVSETWSPAGSMTTCRANHAAVVLEDGRVLVVGGEDHRGILASAEVYDPG